MATRPVMEFKRGTGVTHYFKLPVADHVAGASLFFTAKEDIDNDSTDAAAVIDKAFTDADLALVSDSVYDALYATYVLEFDADDIATILFTDGETEKDYLGEFKYIVSGAEPVSFPADDQYIQVKVYANVKLGTT